MRRQPPRSTRVRSSAASDVYKRQGATHLARHSRRRRRPGLVTMAPTTSSPRPPLSLRIQGRLTISAAVVLGGTESSVGTLAAYALVAHDHQTLRLRCRRGRPGRAPEPLPTGVFVLTPR